MANVTIRDLRNKSADVLKRVGRGESLTVTRDGEPVAAIVPLPRKPLSAAQLVERWKQVPPIDVASLRSDVEEVVDQAL